MYEIKDKQKNIDLLNSQMLNKTLSMFEYQGLPESLKEIHLERILQTHGYCFIIKHTDDNIYALTGSLGGQLDAYNEFTEIIINNPYLEINKKFNIKTDGVLIRSDDLMMGLLPIYNKLNYLIVENDINVVMWGYNSRQQKVFSASDDKTKVSAENYIKKIVDGEISVISDIALIESLNINASSSGNNTRVQEFIELQQYLKSNLFNEVGLSSNFNMKKERLISSEVDLGEDSIFPLVYTMMKNRIAGVKAVNEMFDLNIDVDFGSVWALKNKKLVDGVIEDESDKLNAVVNGDNPIPNLTATTEEEINQDGERDVSQNSVLEPDLELTGDNDSEDVAELKEDVETELDVEDKTELDVEAETELDVEAETELDAEDNPLNDNVDSDNVDVDKKEPKL